MPDAAYIAITPSEDVTSADVNGLLVTGVARDRPDRRCFGAWAFDVLHDGTSDRWELEDNWFEGIKRFSIDQMRVTGSTLLICKLPLDFGSRPAQAGVMFLFFVTRQPKGVVDNVLMESFRLFRRLLTGSRRIFAAQPETLDADVPSDADKKAAVLNTIRDQRDGLLGTAVVKRPTP